MANSDYTTRGSGDFTPNATLAQAVTPLATTLTVFSFQDGGMSDPNDNSMAMLDEEIVQVVTFTPTSLTVKRGCADTIPAAHAQAATVWFFERSIATDGREYGGDATVSVKPLVRTNSSVTPVDKAPPIPVAFNYRFVRPYPPANVLIGGSPWFSAAPYLTDAAPGLTLTWAHRNRVTQADVIVGHTESSVAPEVGQEYRVRIYDADDVLRHTIAGLTGTSWAYSRDQISSALSLFEVANTGDYTATVRFDSMRDGYSSLQAYRIPLKVDTTGLANGARVFAVEAGESLTGMVTRGLAASAGIEEAAEGVTASAIRSLMVTMSTADDSESMVAAVAENVVTGVTADNLVFELLASQYVSGQTLANQVATPHDGSGQTAYDFVFGATSSASSDDPTFSTDHFGFDGGDFFTLAGASTAFLKSMHKAGAKFTIEVWMQWDGTIGTNVHPLFDSGTSDQGGADMSRGFIYGDMGSLAGGPGGRHKLRVMRDSSGTPDAGVYSDTAIPTGSVQMLACSIDRTGATSSFLYRNGAYDQVGSVDTWTMGAPSPGTADAANAPRIGARGDGAFKLPAGTRLYGIRVYDTNLSKAQLDANYAAGVGASVNGNAVGFSAGSAYITYSDSGRTATPTGGGSWVTLPVAMAVPSSGKTYVEFDCTSATGPQMLGVTTSGAVDDGHYLGAVGDAVSNGDNWRRSGSVFTDINTSGIGSSHGNVLGVGIDQTAGRVHWYLNGTLFASEASFTPGTAGLYFAAGINNGRGPVTLRLPGAATIPSGYTYLGE